MKLPLKTFHRKFPLKKHLSKGVPYKRCCLRFHKIRRKTPVPESRPRPATLKKRLWHRCFPVNFVKFLRTPILLEHLQWLLLPLFVMVMYKKQPLEVLYKKGAFRNSANFTGASFFRKNSNSGVFLSILRIFLKKPLGAFKKHPSG